MGPLFVILQQPFGGDLPYLLQRLKHIGTEHFSAIGPIIAFDDGILIRFPRLNMSHLNCSFGTPRHESLGDELRTVVEPKGFRLAAPGHDLFEDADHVLRRQGRIYFDRQGLSHAFIQNIEGLKPSTPVQSITHEIHRRDHVRYRDHF